jgi:hypothetical protein
MTPATHSLNPLFLGMEDSFSVVSTPLIAGVGAFSAIVDMTVRILLHRSKLRNSAEVREKHIDISKIVLLKRRRYLRLKL